MIPVGLAGWLDAALDDASSESFAHATQDANFVCLDHIGIPLAPLIVAARNRARAPARLLLIAHAPGAYVLEWVLLRLLLSLNPPHKSGSNTARQRRKCPLNWDDGNS